MLYPDFNDLISYRGRKLGKVQLARRKAGLRAPGNQHSFFRGQGLDFDAVREYVPGDDIRNIDWRVTARTGSAHLKLFKEEKERHTIICVDMNSGMRFGTRNTFKSIQAARCASLLGWRALAHQDRLSACLFGDMPGGLQCFASKNTRHALGMMLRTLTEPPKEQHTVPIETALQHIARVMHPGSFIYLISDFMDLPPDFSKKSGLSHLSKSCEIAFITVNDRSDETLPPARVIGFCGQNAEKVYINTDNDSGRKSYAAQWEDSRRALNVISKSFKIPLISLSTESNIYPDLLLKLKILAKRKL